MKPRIIVTGASGFIGRQTLAPLTNLGFEVHAICRNNFLKNENVIWQKCDLFNNNQTLNLLSAINATHLLHCAWFTKHQEFWSSTQNYYWRDASFNLFENFVTSGGHTIVGLGSCAEYDWHRQDNITWKETDYCEPHTIYGKTKLELALWLQNWATIKKINYSWARLFLLFGKHEHHARIIPYLINAAINYQSAQCSSGTQVRDFLDTQTCGQALAELVVSDLPGVVNVASGKGYSLRQVANMITNIVNHDVDYQFGAVDDRTEEPPYMVADISKFKSKCHTLDNYVLETALLKIINRS